MNSLIMKKKYQKPLVEIVTINSKITMLQSSATLSVNWTEDVVDAEDAD